MVQLGRGRGRSGSGHRARKSPRPQAREESEEQKFDRLYQECSWEAFLALAAKRIGEDNLTDDNVPDEMLRHALKQVALREFVPGNAVTFQRNLSTVCNLMNRHMDATICRSLAQQFRQRGYVRGANILFALA